MSATAPTVTGLTSSEASSRRADGKGNAAPKTSSRTYRDIIRHNLFTFINITLIGVGIVLLLLGQPRDALMSSGLAVINAIVGIIQESLAKRRLDEISLMTRPTATVIRDGTESEVDPSELVLGDSLVAGSGDQIMLDGTIVDGEIEVDESLLTGETDHVRRATGETIMAGTFCVSGRAIYEAEKVGNDTMAGRITTGARTFSTSLTPLQRDVNIIIKVLLVIAMFLLALDLTRSLIWNTDLNETVIGAAVILGIVPSGLFLMITVTYSLGAVRLANKNALVQQVNAVESLSNVDVFCADKTGTLTTNKLQLEAAKPIDIDESVLRAALGAFSASVSAGNKTSDAIGESIPANPVAVVGEVPFDSARKWSAISLDSDKLSGTYALGAPEMLGPLVANGDTLEPPDGWQERGLRVLLFASSDTPSTFDDPDNPILPDDMNGIGWLAFRDELRPNLDETLRGFRDAGVRLKIISGDNPETVAGLARQAGFPNDAVLISGIELAQMSDAEFVQAAEEGDIFGRITPDQKERLVGALRDHRHYVAMTGDGVNDVLSIKKADLGIAMESGSQATRAVADIVLLNDSFAAVPAAFAEGQRIRNGLQEILDLFLVRVFTVALIIMAAIFVGAGFPFSPANMTLLTLLTVGIPTFGLAMFTHPGVPSGRIFKPLVRFVLPATMLLLVTSLFTYLSFHFINDVDLAALRAGTYTSISNPEVTDSLARDALTYVMVLSGLVLVVFAAPPNEWWAVIEKTEHDWRPTLVAAAMVPLYIAILAIPWTRDLFEIRLLDWDDYVLIAVVVVLWTILLRYVWKSQVFERYFGFASKPQETVPVATESVPESVVEPTQTAANPS